MQEPLPEAREYGYGDITVGMKEHRRYKISHGVYGHFLAAFDDRSPIHVDEAYAKACGHEGMVMHGTLLNGFLSHFVGMYFPGKNSLLLSVDIRYAQPSYLGDEITLEAEVARKLDAQKVIVLNVVLKNTTRDCIAARGRVQVMMKDES